MKKSLSSVLNERVTSPFWGTVIVSWLLWNWKIFVLLFFVDENMLPINKNTDKVYTKIEYIGANYLNTSDLLWSPLTSTLIILLVAPFFVNGSYWLSLQFKKWRIDQKNSIEERQMLTLPQSMELRKEMHDQEKQLQSLIEKKDTIIGAQNKTIDSLNRSEAEKDNLLKQYEKQMEINNQKVNEIENLRDHLEDEKNKALGFKGSVQELQNELKHLSDNFKSLEEQYREVNEEKRNMNNELQQLRSVKERYLLEDNLIALRDKVFGKDKLKTDFSSLMFYIQKNRGDVSGARVESNSIAFFESRNIIEQDNKGMYTFTSKGKEFLKYYTDVNFEDA